MDGLIDVSCSKVVVRVSRSESLPKVHGVQASFKRKQARPLLDLVQCSTCSALSYRGGEKCCLLSRPFVSVAGAISKTDLRLVLLLFPRTLDLDLSPLQDLQHGQRRQVYARLARPRRPSTGTSLTQGSRTRLRRPRQPVPHPLRLSRPRPSTSHPEQLAEDLWQGWTHPRVRRSLTERNGDRSIPKRSIRSITSPSPSSPSPNLYALPPFQAERGAGTRKEVPLCLSG